MPTYSVKDLEALGLIQHYSRSPFQKALAIWLKAGPTPEHIHAAAAKSPDRWAQGTAILGRLAGYSDRIELDQSLTVTHLSDAELEARIAQLTATLRALPASPVRAVKPPRATEASDTASTTLIAQPEPTTAPTAPRGEPLSITAGTQPAQPAGDTHRPSPGPRGARARSQRSAAQVQG